METMEIFLNCSELNTLEAVCCVIPNFLLELVREFERFLLLQGS